MRTRSSWRNQDRLWRYLGQEGQPTTRKPQPTAPKTEAEIDALPGLSERAKARIKADAARAAARQRVADLKRYVARRNREGVAT